MPREIKGEAVNLRETTTVVGVKHPTARKQKLEVGKEYKVHPLVAKNLIRTGHAEVKGGKNVAAKTKKDKDEDPE